MQGHAYRVPYRGRDPLRFAPSDDISRSTENPRSTEDARAKAAPFSSKDFSASAEYLPRSARSWRIELTKAASSSICSVRFLASIMRSKKVLSEWLKSTEGIADCAKSAAEPDSRMST